MDFASARRAVPVELQPVPLDLVPGRSGKIPHQVAHGAVIEVLHLPASRADEVVVVLGPVRQAIVKASVVQEHPADNAQFGEQPYRAEHCRSAGPPAAMEKVFHAEMPRLLEDGRYYGAPGRRHPVTAGLEFQA